MEFEANRVDEANAIITSKVSAETIATNLDKLAKQLAKTIDIQGFRKGKVPVSIVKQRYSKKLEEDSNSQAVRTLLSEGLAKLEIANENIIGEPAIMKFDKNEKDGSIDVEIKVACKPNIDLGDYKALIPAVKLREVEAKDVDIRIDELAKQSAPLGKIKRKRMVRKGDFALIDFEGFVNGVAFDGGKGEKYPLEIGSNSFISGFEDQIIGMKYEDEKDVTVTFPKTYQQKELAGKEAVFKVKLHEIQEKVPTKIDDELATKLLPDEKNATIDILRTKIKEQIQAERKMIYYKEELKPLFLDKLVSKLNFALPSSVVDQEINYSLNNKVKEMSKEQIKELQEDQSRIETIKDGLKGGAQSSVKATFIVDALAKKEGVEISDQEVAQVVYYEAIQTGQNPKNVLKQYQDAGYLAAIKMSMVEDKVITKLLDEKLEK